MSIWLREICFTFLKTPYCRSKVRTHLLQLSIGCWFIWLQEEALSGYLQRCCSSSLSGGNARLCQDTDSQSALSISKFLNSGDLACRWYRTLPPSSKGAEDAEEGVSVLPGEWGTEWCGVGGWWGRTTIPQSRVMMKSTFWNSVVKYFYLGYLFSTFKKIFIPWFSCLSSRWPRKVGQLGFWWGQSYFSV